MGIIVRNMNMNNFSHVRLGSLNNANILDLNLMNRPSSYTIEGNEYNLVQSYWDGTDFYKVSPSNVPFILERDINSYTIDVEMDPQFIGLNVWISNNDIFLINVNKNIHYGIYRNGIRYGGVGDGFIFQSQYSTLPAALSGYRVQYDVNLEEYMYRIRYIYNDNTRRMVIIKNYNTIMYDQILPVSYKLFAGDSYKLLTKGFSTHPEHIRIKSIKIIED